MRFSGFAALMAAALFAFSCNTADEPLPPEKETLVELSFSPGGILKSSLWTKTRSAVAVNEDDIIGAAIGIYDSSGSLVYTARAEGLFNGFSEPAMLHSGQAYSCYLVTGYIATVIDYPQKEAELQELTIENTQKNGSGVYDLTATLRDYGPDCAGSLLGMTPERLDALDGETDGCVTIEVCPLWAKVSVSIDFSGLDKLNIDFEGGRIQSCGARWGSRYFAPFKADGNSTFDPDSLALLPTETRSDVADAQAGAFVFYIPENRMGTLLPGNQNSDDKTPSAVALRHGAGVASAVEKCAVELCSPARAVWGDSGSLTYRFCLGKDELTNFDIDRNTHYSISLAATADGYLIKDWKAGSDIEDSRQITLRPCIYNNGFVNSNSVTVNPDQSFYLVPDYFLGSDDHTASAYGETYGWGLSDQTKEALARYGISYSLTSKYIYGRPLSTDVTYSDDISWMPPKSVFDFFDGARTLTDVLIFTPQTTLEGGLSIPVTVESFDHRHSATVTVNTDSSGHVTVVWEYEPHYIAQQGRLRVDSTTGSAASVTYSLEGDNANYLELDSAADDGTCTVSAIKGGTAQITYTGWNAQGNKVCEGSIPVTINVPLLRCSTSICELSPDGTPVTVNVYYTDESGHAIQDFVPSLYSELLTPVASTTTGQPYSGFLNISGTTVRIARFSYGQNGIQNLIGQTFTDGLSFNAVNAPQVVTRHCNLKFKAPLGYAGTDKKIGGIDNLVGSGGNSVQPGNAAVVPGQTSLVCAAAFTYGASLSSLSVNNLPDISFSLGEDGSLYATGIAAPQALTAGKTILNIDCRNSVSGETITIPSGYINIYLHAAPLAVINLNEANPPVSTELSGAQLNAGLAQLQQRLLEGPPCVRCSFANGSYYSLGNGHWNYNDEFDSQGNQYIAPQQQYFLTEFIDATWQGPVKIGETAYTIIIGVLEADAGRYNSLENFLATGEYAPIYLDYTGLDFSYGSPDENGNSFYVLDTPLIPDWKKF